MKAWHIGNTTVRTPYRLKEALQVLRDSPFHGNLLGSQQEEGFAKLLHREGVVNAERLREGQTASGTGAGDLGRKWRSAMVQLGFVVCHAPKGTGEKGEREIKLLTSQLKDLPPGEELTGKAFQITPNGHRLIRAQTLSQQQECFLRALVTYTIPSFIENRYKCDRFSPLRFVLEILAELERHGQEPRITFDEMAFFVQRYTPRDRLEQIASQIRSYRSRRKEAESKRAFDRQLSQEIADQIKLKPGTLTDYADVNFRYLKATGLFQSRGRGIMAAPEKAILIQLILSHPESPYSDVAYARSLWQGAQLPTDDKINAIAVIRDLANQIEKHGEEYDIKDIETRDEADLSQFRLKLEDRLMQLKELEYANAQSQYRNEIIQSIEYFLAPKPRSVIHRGEVTGIRGEAPAYFEWITWRAFLAIGSLVNMPWEARRFKIDTDFLPLSHAPGGGPDMVFEFDQYVLVVEVTLTASSRQEAAEGEPVRRHVAEIARKYENSNKEVYCLFIAVKVDSNTAETFKSGNWYKKDDTKLPLQIVPLSLADFHLLLKTGFETHRLGPGELLHFLLYCRSLSNHDAPQWKAEIHSRVERFTSRWSGRLARNL